MDALLKDIRYALRGLVHAPGLTAAAIVCLALGIGANATMFGIVDALLFKAPAHIADADHVTRIYFQYPGTNGQPGAAAEITGYGTYLALRDNAPAFQDVAAYWATTSAIGRGTNAQAVDVVLVTPSFFRALGVRPLLGRFLTDDEERAESNKAVVLGYELWKGRFNGDAGVLGREVQVGGQSYTVVGVAPREFTGVDLKRVDAWLPIGAATTMFSSNALSHDNNLWLSTIGHLRPGVPREVAAAQTTAAFAVEHTQQPWTKGARAILAPLQIGRGPSVGTNTKVSLWLGLVSFLVLLVACANVANLLLARAVGRSREIALRLSLGAGRWRIARQLFTESLALAMLGAVAALLVTAWTSAFVRRVVVPDIPLLGHAVSLRMLVFAAAIALGTGLLCGLAPTLITMRTDLNGILKGSTAGRGGRFLLQRSLAVGQVALTVVLLAGAGLFVRSLQNIRDKDLGMNAAHTIYASVNFRSAGVPDDVATARYQDLLARVRALPGVSAAAFSSGEPFYSGWGTSITPLEGDAAQVKPPRFSAMGRAVTDEFFRATNRRFVSGRPFTNTEHSATGHAAIINEGAAHYYWPHGGALGACIATSSDDKSCTRIVGIVADAPQYRLTGDIPQELYLPYEFAHATHDQNHVSMMEIRTDGDPHVMVAPIRHAMEAAGADIPFPKVQPLTDIIDPQYRPWQLGTDMFSAFGALALLLAAVGLYGVLAYEVVQRTRELGIRAALGAPRATLVRTVVRTGVATALIGTLIGILAALGAGRFVAALLYQVSARDPVSLGIAAGVLIAVAAIASYVPARRAARADPMEALRAE